MKHITDFLNESAEPKLLDAKDIKGKLTAATQNGEPVVIIGKPFKNEEDPQYDAAKGLCKKLGLDLSMDIQDCYDNDEHAGEVEYWVIAVNRNDEAAVWEYGPAGVVAEK